MDQNQLEEGISIIELLEIIWKRKIIIGIATIATALLFVLIVVFGLNPNSIRYQSTFELQFPGIMQDKYPSGYTFNYKDIISDDNIIAVIENNEEYKKINIDEFTNDTITINETNISNSSTAMNRTFVINVDGSLFNSKTQASTFVSELVDVTYTKVVGSLSDLSFSTYLDNAKTASTFELQLSLLSEQVNYINGLYTNLISEFGDVMINGDTLLNHKTKYDAYFATNSIDNLINELKNNIYVKNYEENLIYLELNKSTIESNINLLTRQISALDAKVDSLLTSGSGSTPDIDSYNIEIARLTLEKVSLEYDKEMIENKIANGNTAEALAASKAFGEKIENIQTELEKFIGYYKSNVEGVYDQFTYITFEDRAVVVSTGTISFILAGLVGAVMAGGISCVVFIALDLTKKNKEEVKTA